MKRLHLVDAPKRLLLIEDDPDSAEAMLLRLEYEGFRIQWARDAAEAHEALECARRSGGHLPDAVLLDLELPGISGIEFGRELMNLSIALPIIVISAASESAIRQAVREIRAVAGFRKPFSMNEVLSTLGQLFATEHQADLA
jgi:DNA-binding response OmpR family regulator